MMRKWLFIFLIKRLIKSGKYKDELTCILVRDIAERCFLDDIFVKRCYWRNCFPDVVKFGVNLENTLSRESKNMHRLNALNKLVEDIKKGFVI